MHSAPPRRWKAPDPPSYAVRKEHACKPGGLVTTITPPHPIPVHTGISGYRWYRHAIGNKALVKVTIDPLIVDSGRGTYPSGPKVLRRWSIDSTFLLSRGHTHCYSMVIRAIPYPDAISGFECTGFWHVPMHKILHSMQNTGVFLT